MEERKNLTITAQHCLEALKTKPSTLEAKAEKHLPEMLHCFYHHLWGTGEALQREVVVTEVWLAPSAKAL